MGTASALYRIVLLLHIAAAIVGFGGLLANAINNAKAYRSPIGKARTLLQSTESVGKVSEYGIYGLLALGVVLIAVSDSAISFGAPWISASFLVWFIIVGATHGLVRPATRGLIARTEALAADAPGQAMPILESDSEAGNLARRLATGEAVVQIMMVIALALMIWKPGN